jgi:hypothetical protein
MTGSFRIAASTIGIAVSLTALTSCASETPGAGSPVASAGSSATASATPTPDTPCPEGTTPGPWGDVVALEQMHDSFGSYCHVALAPDVAAAQFDASVADTDSLTTYGFTVQDAEAAQQVAVQYVAELGLDSTRLDDYSTSDSAFFETIKNRFTATAQAALAPRVEAYGLRDTGVIVTQSLPSPLGRTGDPRASSTEISVDKIFAGVSPDQGTPLLSVRVPFSAVYGATDASIVEAAIRNERGPSTLTEDGLRSSTPSLFDGNDEEGLVLAGSYTVSFGLGDLSTIDYISTAWTLTTGDGALQIDAVEPELDPSQR